jgi:hypothetical protein
MYVVITNSIKRRPTWKCTSRSAGQEIPQILWNTEIHYHGHILGYISAPHSFRSCSFNFSLTINQQRASKWSLAIICLGHESQIMAMLQLFHAVLHNVCGSNSCNYKNLSTAGAGELSSDNLSNSFG